MIDLKPFYYCVFCDDFYEKLINLSFEEYLSSLFIRKYFQCPKGHKKKVNKEEDWKRSVEGICEIAKVAGECGVYCCLEVLNRFEGYLINTVEQASAIIQEVGSPNLKIQLDTFHLNIEADDIGQSIREAGHNLGHFHCVANNRKPPGAGHIPWNEVKQALDDISYQGYLVAETFVNPTGEVGRGLYIWRSLADDLDQTAKQAADFMKQTFV